jgi:polyisoprenyl-phosphate glycosyltransferase
MYQVSAIIPSYNEGSRIQAVLAVLRRVPELLEIVVVDDGSTDSTREEVRAARHDDARIRLLKLPANRGKGQAVLAAAETIRTNLVLLLDADLIALQPKHIRALIRPVVSGRAAMTIGLFRGGWWFTDMSHILTPWLSGQRCLKIELLKYLSEDSAQGYGLEVALSVTAELLDYPVERIIWRGVSHPPAEIHRGFGRVVAWRTRMYGQVCRAWFANQGPAAAKHKIVRKLNQIRHDPLRAWHTTRERASRSRE